MPFLGPPPSSDENPRPNLFTRFGEDVANIVPELGYAAGFSQKDETPEQSNWFNPPPAKGGGEVATDVFAGIVKSLPLLLSGEAAGAGIAELAGAGKTATSIIKGAAAFGAASAPQGPKEAVESAALGGTFSVAELMPTRYRIPLAALLGAATGTESYLEDNNLKKAAAVGSVNALIPFANKLPFLKGEGEDVAKAAKEKAAQITPEGTMAKPAPDLIFTPKDTGGPINLPTKPGPTLDEALAKADQEDADLVATLQKTKPIETAPVAPTVAEPITPTVEPESPKIIQPLARKGEEGYVNTTDIITQAKAIVGEDAFKTLAEDRATGTTSPATEAMAVENAARKVVAQDMLSKGQEVKARPGSIIWQEIQDETVEKPSPESEQGKLNSVLKSLDIARDNAAKTEGGLKLRPKLDAAGVPVEVLWPISKYSLSILAGGVVGATLSDPDKRMQGALEGAVMFGLGAKFGPGVLRALRDAHPDIGKADSVAGKSKAVIDAVTENAVKLSKAVTANPELASEALKNGWADGYEKLARWLQQRYVVTPALKRVMQRAQGEAGELGKLLVESVTSVAKMTDTNVDARLAIGKYFRGEVTDTNLFATLQNDTLAKSAQTARQTLTALQKVVSKGLPEGKLKSAIDNSFGDYITKSYQIFHDPKYQPTDEQIQKAAASLNEVFGSVDVRARMVREYLREIKFNQGLYGRGLKGYGEAFGGLLTRDQAPSAEFKAMLGEYDDPIREAAVTGMKLINAAKTSEFFDQVANGVKENGLKMVYDSRELDSLQNELRTRIASGRYNGSELAMLQSKLKDLSSYVPNISTNPALGKLGSEGLFIDARMREGLATYDQAITKFHHPVIQTMMDWTNLIKYGHTVLSPFQFVRQVFSIPLLGLMGRTGPQDWWKAYSTLRAGGEEVDRLRRLGIFYGDVIGGQFHQDMKAMVGGKLDAVLNDRFRSGLRSWEEIYRLPDLITRVASFQKEESRMLMKGAAAKEAEDAGIDFANKWAINYGATPKGIQFARQLPFVNQYLSFAYEMARITGNHIQAAIKDKDPYSIGFLTTMATVPLVIEKLSEQTALNEQDRADWQIAKSLGPEYSRSNFKFVTSRDDQGRFHYIDFTPIIPLDHWMKLSRDIMGRDLPAVMADNPVFGWQYTPLLNVASSQIQGRDLRSKEDYTPLSVSVTSNIADRFSTLRKEAFPAMLGGNEMDRWARAFTPNNEGGLGLTNVRSGSHDSPLSLLMTYVSGTRGYQVDLTYREHQAVQQAKVYTEQLQSQLKRVMNTNVSDAVKDRAYQNFIDKQQKVLLNLSNQLRLNDSSTSR